ncbi:MAG: dTDP-4-dehydrorhamnose reductase [Planctomycetota bacterium]|nr:MAG: dTDP-4-dehydrorhamnose reductase [Planctomycetota bacterium]
MRIVIIGFRGQLGNDIAESFGSDGDNEVLEISGPDIAQPGDTTCDITDRDQLFDTVRPFGPDRIFNCAAFTQVDACENDADSAFMVNVVGVVNIADLAKECESELIHFSTDYVFNGKKDEPYTEDDAPDPLNIYGASKLAGELALKRRLQKHFLFRVSGLYGVAGSLSKGDNFVETMIRLGKEKGSVRVVADQRLAPTFTADLAEKVIEVADTGKYGLYHLAASGDCSWFEFAKEIFSLTGMEVDCGPQSTAESGRKANRPPYSVLSSKKLDELGIKPIRHWREGLADYLKRKGHI